MLLCLPAYLIQSYAEIGTVTGLRNRGAGAAVSEILILIISEYDQHDRWGRFIRRRRYVFHCGDKRYEQPATSNQQARVNNVFPMMFS